MLQQDDVMGRLLDDFVGRWLHEEGEIRPSISQAHLWVLMHMALLCATVLLELNASILAYSETKDEDSTSFSVFSIWFVDSFPRFLYD